MQIMKKKLEVQMEKIKLYKKNRYLQKIKVRIEFCKYEEIWISRSGEERTCPLDGGV